LPVLLELAGPAAPKTRKVGLMLGFPKNELDEMEKIPAVAVEGPEAYFTEMLSRWLKWAPPNHDFPSSRTLAEALRSKLVKEEGLAYDLEQHFSETGELREGHHVEHDGL